MAIKKVSGVELVLVDADVLSAAIKVAGLEASGNAADDVKKYAAWVKANVTKEDMASCDNCGGDSSIQLPRCPYCGTAGVADDAATSTPDFEELRSVPSVTPKPPKASAAKKAAQVKTKQGKSESPEALVPPQSEPELRSGDCLRVVAEVITESGGATDPAIAVGDAVPGLTIEDGINAVNIAKVSAVHGYWDLGHAILACYRGDLWKQLRDKSGAPLHKSFRSFCEGSLQMQAQYAYKVMQIANSYTRDDCTKVGVAKLGIMLRLPNPERQRLLEEAKANNLPLRQVAEKVREQAAGKPARPGAGKRGPVGEATKAGTEKAKPKKDVFTATLQRRTKVPLMAAKGFGKAGEEKRAKRLADAPVAEFESLNGVVIRAALVQDAKGELVLVLEVKK